MKKAECDALRFFFAHILDQRGVLYERLELRRLDHRHLRAGIGTGHPDRGRLSCGVSDVSGGVSADRLRDRMLKGREVTTMKIVIWKAPRCLRGLLRRMFGIRE